MIGSPVLQAIAHEAAPIPKLHSITDFIASLVPPNPIAAADGVILPLIVFTALFAAAAEGAITETKNSNALAEQPLGRPERLPALIIAAKLLANYIHFKRMQ